MGSILSEMPPPIPILESLYSNLTDIGVPPRSRLVFRGVTPGEGMAMDALAEGFFD